MKEEKIRPIAICVCRDRKRVLVIEYREKSRIYYRPVGGAIEFGERGADAVQREFREEIATGLTEIRYLGTLENIYTDDGQRAHQIVLVYDGRLSDASLYERESIPVDELGTPFIAVWKRLDEFGPEKPPLYPEGLAELLEN